MIGGFQMMYQNNLQKIRKQHHFTHEELAERVGVCRKTLSKIERGSQDPPLCVAYELVHVLGEDLETIFTPTETL